MKPVSVVLVAFTILLSLTPRGVLAKNAYIGIYAIVDQVTLEPNERSPQFIGISGVFVVPTQFGGITTTRRKATYISESHPKKKRQSERIGNSSRVLREQVKWSRLASIGCQVRLTRKAIHTIRCK